MQSGTATVTVVGFAERLTDLMGYGQRTLHIQALPGNTGIIYVGDNNVTSTQGIPLDVTSSSGDVLTLKAHDPRDVWIDASVAGEGVTWSLDQ